MGLRTFLFTGVIVAGCFATGANAGYGAVGETPGNTTGTGIGSGTPGGNWATTETGTLISTPMIRPEILIERLGSEINPDAAIAYSVTGFRKWPVVEVRMAEGADLEVVNRKIEEIGQGPCERSWL